MSSRGWKVFLVCGVAVLVLGCGEIIEVPVQVEGNNVVFSTRISIETNPSEESCQAAQSDFEWGADLFEQGAEEIPVEVEQVFSFEPSVLDDEEQTQTAPGGCIYKASITLAPGAYAFRARREGPPEAAWSTFCPATGNHELTTVDVGVPQTATVDFTFGQEGCVFFQTLE